MVCLPALQDLDHAPDDLVHFGRSEAPNLVENKMCVGGKQPIRAHGATLLEITSREVGRVELDGILITQFVARDLTEDAVVTFESSQDEGWSALGQRQI